MPAKLPIAIQVANRLRGQFRRDYAGGGRLPGENVLAAELGVSRGTLRQALAILQHEGLIYRRQGLGTFANPHAPGISTRIDFAYEFTELIHAAGFESAIRTLAVGHEAADDKTAAALDREPGEPLLRLRKLFLADGRPAIFVHELLPEALIVEPYEPAELDGPIWHFLGHRCHCQLKYVLSELLAVLAEGEVAEQLQVAPGSPLLKFEEVFYSDHDKPLALALIHFGNPMIRFHALRKVPMATLRGG